MNKKKSNIIAALAVVILIIGAVVLLSGRDNSEVTNSQNAGNSISPQQANQSPPQRAATPAAQLSTGVDGYVPYSETVLSDARGTKRVVFFHADWCPTCRGFESEIRQEGVPEGITIVKASFDNDVDLKREYGVTVQSTFVLLDENGEPAMRWPFGQGLSGITDLYEQVASSQM